ncbi:MAG: hypothetical protein K0U93_26005 [Gammaproteobacteria bacterium]|nr:hypothetical protein [Gammaproteobacteria bacterium]
MAASDAVESEFGLADSGPIRYIDRTRNYYLTLGFGNPYQWAHHRDVPFTPLTKPLAESKLGLFSTAAPFRDELGDQGPGAAYNSAAKFYKVYAGSLEPAPDVRISHLGYDRIHTTAADSNTYFPRDRLLEVEASGRVGEVSKRFYGLPTNRSQKVTVEQDCVDMLRLAREDNIDVAVLVPN